MQAEPQIKNKVIEEQEKLIKAMNLGSVISKRSFEVYLEAKSKQVLRGFSSKEIAAGTVFVACMLEALPVTIRDISLFSGVDQRSLWSVAKCLHKAGIVNRITAPRDLASLLDIKFKDRICEKDLHKLKAFLRRKSGEIKRMAGHISPSAVIGAVVWLSSKRKFISQSFTQLQLSKLLKVNEVSIRIASKKIRSTFEDFRLNLARI